jgi:hypothetical protein
MSNLSLVVHQIVKANSPMRADPAEGNLSFLNEADQKRARHVQQFSGLLGGEFRTHGRQHHGVALSHLDQDVHQ